MRHLLVLPLIVLVLATACRGGDDAGDARLVAIDSLTAAAPDSALTLLAAIDTAALDEPDRAYHALLTAQAAYKAYRPATDSALIARARRHYAHGGPYDRRLRTMLYSGTTAEELGDPEQAMRWYKQAEDFARRDDHYYRGYAIMRQASLYQFQYTQWAKAIAHYRSAMDHFAACGDKHYVAVCLTNMGMLYRIVDSAQAVVYARKAIDTAAEIGDSTLFYENVESLAGLAYKNKDWQQLKRLAMDVVSRGMTAKLHSCYYFAAQAYLFTGNADSAAHLFSIAPEPRLTRDSILYFRTKSLFEKHSMDYESSTDNLERASSVAGKAIFGKLAHDVGEAEMGYDKQKQLHRNRTAALLLVTVIAVALCGLFYFVRRYRSLRRLYEQAKQNLAAAAASLENKLNQLANQSQAGASGEAELQVMQPIEDTASDADAASPHAAHPTGEAKDNTSHEAHAAVRTTPSADEPCAANGRQQDSDICSDALHDDGEDGQDDSARLLDMQRRCISSLFNAIVYSGSRGTSVFKYLFDFEKAENTSLISFSLPYEFWEGTRDYFNTAFPGAIENIQKENGVRLTEKELQLIYLDCLGVPNAAISVALGYAERTTASKRFKLTQKINCQGKPILRHIKEMSDYC